MTASTCSARCATVPAGAASCTGSAAGSGRCARRLKLRYVKLRYVEPDSPHAAGIRTVEHTDPGSGLALHGLATGLAEAKDLSTERPDLVAELTARHESWRAATR